MVPDAERSDRWRRHRFHQLQATFGAATFVVVFALAVLVALPTSRDPLVVSGLATLIGAGLVLFPALRRAAGTHTTARFRQLCAGAAAMTGGLLVGVGVREAFVATRPVVWLLSVSLLGIGTATFFFALRAFASVQVSEGPENPNSVV